MQNNKNSLFRKRVDYRRNNYDALANGVERHFSDPQIMQLPNSPTKYISYHHHGNCSSHEKVLFIMGLFTSKEAWMPVIDSILRKVPLMYHMVTYDNRGVGGSGTPAALTRYTTKDLAGDALALMKALQWNQAHIVGVSMGGMIALELAATEPNMVKSLSLLVTSSGLPRTMMPGPRQLQGIYQLLVSVTLTNVDEILQNLVSILYPTDFLEEMYDPASGRTNRHVVTEIHRVRIVQGGRRFSRHAALGQLSAVASHAITSSRLEIIRQAGFPILVLAAEKDKLIHPDNSKALYKSLASDHTQARIYQGAGHGVLLQCMDDVTGDLLATFARAKPSLDSKL